MIHLSEQQFNQWLREDFSCEWQGGATQISRACAQQPAWMGYRTLRPPTGQHPGHSMLLARVPVEPAAMCVYGEFRPAQAMRIELEPHEDLLLTFFIEGDLQGFNGGPSAQPLPFGSHTILLRKPNRRFGSTVQLKAGSSTRFLQLRLKAQSLVSWMHSLDLQLPAQRLKTLQGDDGDAIWSSHWSAQTYASLPPWPSVAHMRLAMLPLLRAKSLELLTLFCTEFAAGHVAHSPRHNGAQLIKAVYALIHSRMQEPWTIQALAQQLGCSAHILNKASIEQHACGMPALIKQWRLQRAQELLAQGHLTVTEVAYRVGMPAAGRFAQSYQKAFGYLPSHSAKAAPA